MGCTIMPSCLPPPDRERMVPAVRHFRDTRGHRRPSETATICDFIWGSVYKTDLDHLNEMQWLDLEVLKPWVNDVVLDRYVDGFCSKALFGIQHLVDRPDVSVLSIWSGRVVWRYCYELRMA